MMMITRSYGQLGNRLWLSAHLIAAAREYGVTLLNPAFTEYASYFPSTCDDLWCRYPCDGSIRRSASRWQRYTLYKSVYLTSRIASHLRLTRFPAHVIRLGAGDCCDLASDSFAKQARSNRPLLLSGWEFRSLPLLQKHADAVREHYRLFPENEHNVDQVIQRARQDSDMLIGLHIRHGDYATWQNGRYFYTIPQYRQAMQRIAHQFGRKRIGFLVCSNAKLCVEDFAGLNVHFGPGHLVEDMYTFAKTDWLIGPPSTYTGWASFIGDVPLTAMHSHEQEFDYSRVGSLLNAA